MTSIVAGGIFNAVAFAGAGFLFSKLNKEGYKDEMRRHNEAMEKLTKAKEAWYERNVARKDRMAQLRLELDDANKDCRNEPRFENARTRNKSRPRANDSQFLPTVGRNEKVSRHDDGHRGPCFRNRRNRIDKELWVVASLKNRNR